MEGQKGRRMPAKSPNATALYEGQRVAVRAFRGPDRLRATDKPNVVRAGIEGREALIVVDGQERWVRIEELSEWDDKPPV